MLLMVTLSRLPAATTCSDALNVVPASVLYWNSKLPVDCCMLALTILPQPSAASARVKPTTVLSMVVVSTAFDVRLIRSRLLVLPTSSKFEPAI